MMKWAKLATTAVLTIGLSGFAMAQGVNLPTLPKRLPNLKNLEMSAINVNNKNITIPLVPPMRHMTPSASMQKAGEGKAPSYAHESGGYLMREPLPYASYPSGYPRASQAPSHGYSIESPQANRQMVQSYNP